MKTRVMPKKLQIFMFEKLFLKGNADRDDPTAEKDKIDWDLIEDGATFHENLHVLENQYPEYNWSGKTHEERMEKDFPQNTNAVDESEWHEEPEFEICPNCGFTVDGPNHDVWHIVTVIKTHKSKDGKYVRGRIQVTTDDEWIGRAAHIYVNVPKE